MTTLNNINKQHRKLFLLVFIILFIAMFFLNGFTTTTSAQTELNLKFPFATGATWKIVQGYNAGTHVGYQRYSHDYRRDDGAESGKPVYVTASGFKAWGGTASDPQGCISIKSAVNMNYRVMLCHIIFTRDFGNDEYLTQGQYLGTVAPPGQKGNNGIAHIHITLYYLPSGLPDQAGNRIGVPFSRTYGWSLDKAHFPKDDGIANQYRNVYGLCSNQNNDTIVRVHQNVTTGTDYYEKYTFNRNSPIWYWTNVTNSRNYNVTSYHFWKVLGPSGRTIFEWSGNLVEQPGNHWWRVNWTTIPGDAPTGYYTFRDKVYYQGQASCRVNIFRVVP